MLYVSSTQLHDKITFFEYLNKPTCSRRIILRRLLKVVASITPYYLYFAPLLKYDQLFCCLCDALFIRFSRIRLGGGQTDISTD